MLLWQIDICFCDRCIYKVFPNVYNGYFPFQECIDALVTDIFLLGIFLDIIVSFLDYYHSLKANLYSSQSDLQKNHIIVLNHYIIIKSTISLSNQPCITLEANHNKDLRALQERIESPSFESLRKIVYQTFGRS